VIWRLLFGVGTIVTVAVQFAAGSQRPTFDPVNFFSFFTVLSNLFAAGMLIYAGVRLATGQASSWRDDAARGAATLYMAIVGVVYALLLAQYESETLQITLPWVNIMLHRVMPIVVVLDWLLVRSANRLPFTTLRWWLIFPLVYAIYSLVRGAIVSWYPYPFLNPALAGGYVGVGLYCVGICVAVLLIGGLVIWVGNALSFRRGVAAGFA